MTGFSTRQRWLALGLVLLVVTALTAGVVAKAVSDQRERLIPTAATDRDQGLDLGPVLNQPHLLFRSTSAGPTAGRLAAVPLADPGGPRSVSDLSCERIDATPTAGVCLSAQRGALVSYRTSLLDAALKPVRQIGLAGVPSRARLSPDGSLVATTVFVTGHSYATLGFSTETRILDRITGQDYGNLEKTFTMQIDPRRNHAVDLNIWGVTFRPGPRPTGFYATVAAGGQTWLAWGDLRSRTLTAVRSDAECPSLSPDGRVVVYKKRAGSSIRWRFHALDLRTGKEWPLPETRSVDDQVAWLDNSQVAYGVTRRRGRESDVWTTDLRHGPPRILIPDAASPAVVRDPGVSAQS